MIEYRSSASEKMQGGSRLRGNGRVAAPGIGHPHAES
jgi:hypothetical protein